MWMATAAARRVKVKKSAAAKYVTTYPLDYPQPLQRGAAAFDPYQLDETRCSCFVRSCQALISPAAAPRCAAIPHAGSSYRCPPNPGSSPGAGGSLGPAEA